MSHELEMVDGEAQMAYAGTEPWHRLGTKVSNDLTPVQMQEAAGLDWEVGKYTLAAEFNGKRVKSDKMALIRKSDGKILDTVGKEWNPVQNSEAFEFFSEFVLAGDMEMHTAGSLRGGQMVWALAKVKESFTVNGDDRVESFLLFSNPHQYGKSIDVRFTPIRVVCNNTLSFALKGRAGYKTGHRTVFNPEEVKETLGIASEKFAKYKELAEFLSSKKFSVDSLLDYYANVFPRTSGKKVTENVKREDLSRNAELAHSLLEKQPGAEYAPGSWWQAFNSVTYLTDHLHGRNEDNRLYSNWFGGNQNRKVEAMKKAIEFAEAS